MESFKNFVFTDFAILHLILFLFTIGSWTLIFWLLKRLKKDRGLYFLYLGIYMMVYLFPYVITLIFGDVFFLIVYFTFFFTTMPSILIIGIVLVSYLLVCLAREKRNEKKV